MCILQYTTGPHVLNAVIFALSSVFNLGRLSVVFINLTGNRNRQKNVTAVRKSYENV
jgi:hypothetical protein